MQAGNTACPLYSSMSEEGELPHDGEEVRKDQEGKSSKREIAYASEKVEVEKVGRLSD